MRLFVAVFPPPEALDHLAATVARLNLTRRIIPPERWHITLAFLADVPLAPPPPPTAPAGSTARAESAAQGEDAAQGESAAQGERAAREGAKQGKGAARQGPKGSEGAAQGEDAARQGGKGAAQGEGAAQDGAARDGAAREGAAREGAVQGAVREGAVREGAAREGAVREGAVQGAARDGAAREGAAQERAGAQRGESGARGEIGAGVMWGALGRVRVPVGEVCLASGGRFGQVVWAGVSGDAEGLTRLSRAVRRELRAVRVRSDDKQFRAHLTIARSAAGLSNEDMALLKAYQGPRWPVSEFVLVRSELGPHPEYHRLGAWPVSNAPG